MEKFDIAIIGVGCRFPGGASSPDAFWNLLVNGVDAVIDVPTDRWDIRRFYDPDPEKPGKIRQSQGGFLTEKLDRFDPLFFGMSPKEARSLDPQQRILLEISYEAIEDAGLQVEKLKGSPTGVFIGAFSLDNQLLQLSPFNRHLDHAHTITNISMTMLSNRISYTFDLRGPSITMDTGCSSSFAALYSACQGIWTGDIEMAFTGGVSLILLPGLTIAMDKARFLSNHNRCKTFSVNATGFVRAEGAGIVILKPYEQALKDKDNIYAVIKNVVLNQDGKTRSIIVPNPEAQRKLIGKVYSQAGVSLNQVCYIEAHGTGTPVGDRAELTALNEVLAANREPGNKCPVGAVKTNFGHMEAASGMSALIKTALILYHKKIPPNLHFTHLNENFNAENIHLKVATELTKLPDDEILYAGVNSFGYGGTNGHTVLQGNPAQSRNDLFVSPTEIAIDLPILFPISARDHRALSELAKQYHDYIIDKKPALNDLLYSAYLRRSHHDYRFAIVVESLDQLIKSLETYAAGELPKRAFENFADSEEKPGIAFFNSSSTALTELLKPLLIIPGTVIFISSAGEIKDLINNGFSIFIEVGSQPKLRNSITEYLNAAGKCGRVIQILKEENPGLFQLYEAAAELYTLGFTVSWQQIAPMGNFIKLPGYPWQRAYYWAESRFSRQDRLGLPGSVFLNERVSSPDPSWDVELNPNFFPFLNDTNHLTEAAYITSALALSEKHWGKGVSIALQNIEFKEPLVVQSKRIQMLRSYFCPETYVFSIYSWFKEENEEWLLHARGKMITEPLLTTTSEFLFNEIKARCSIPIPGGEIYDKLKLMKFKHGDHFRIIKQAWQGDNELIAQIIGHKSLQKNPDEYLIHPTILDSAFQTAVLFGDKEMAPFFIGRVNYFQSVGTQCWCHCKIKQKQDDLIISDVTFFNDRCGVYVVGLEIKELVFKVTGIRKPFMDFQWQETNDISMPTPGDSYLEMIDRQLDLMNRQLNLLDKKI